MLRVRNVAEILLALQIFPVELRGIGQKVLIAAAVDDVFRHRQTVEIGIRIFDRHQLLHLRCAEPVEGFHVDVVGKRWRPGTVGAVVMFQRFLDIEDVDHERNDADHSLVHGGCCPRGPTAFRRTGYHVVIHRKAFGLCHRGNGIHGADGGLRHRQTQWPGLITTAHELVPGVDDGAVFSARFAFAGEQQRLIRNAAQFSGNGIRSRGNRRNQSIRLFRWRAVDGPAGEIQEGRCLIHSVGNDDREPVMPQRMIDILLSAPLLRSHIVDKLRVAASRRCSHQFVLIVRVGRRDVAVESGMAGRKSRQRDQRQEENSHHTIMPLHLLHPDHIRCRRRSPSSSDCSSRRQNPTRRRNRLSSTACLDCSIHSGRAACGRPLPHR